VEAVLRRFAALGLGGRVFKFLRDDAHVLVGSNQWRPSSAWPVSEEGRMILPQARVGVEA